MKNKILLIAFTVFSIASFAQAPQFGVRAGLASYSIKGEAAENLNNLIDFADGMITTGSRTGFFAGGYADIPLGSNFSVEPGVYYSQKGYALNGDLNLKGLEFLGANASAQLQSQYIDIPVMLKADLGGFQVFAGPQFSYLANADLAVKAGVLGFNLLNKNIDATDEFNRWDAGVTGGVGYKFSNGLNITASYDHGLSKVDKNKNLEGYNRGFKVGIGMSF